MSGNGNGTNDTLTSNRKAIDRFLAKLRDSGNIRLSCQAAGIQRNNIYRWRRKFPSFVKEMDEAKEEALDLLEGEAWKRALMQSDRLLMFLLKAHRPEVYNPPERREISGPDGGAITHVAPELERLWKRGLDRLYPDDEPEG